MFFFRPSLVFLISLSLSLCLSFFFLSLLLHLVLPITTSISLSASCFHLHFILSFPLPPSLLSLPHPPSPLIRCWAAIARIPLLSPLDLPSHSYIHNSQSAMPTLSLRRALILALLSACLVLSLNQSLASASPVEVVDDEINVRHSSWAPHPLPHLDVSPCHVSGATFFPSPCATAPLFVPLFSHIAVHASPDTATTLPFSLPSPPWTLYRMDDPCLLTPLLSQ